MQITFLNESVKYINGVEVLETGTPRYGYTLNLKDPEVGLVGVQLDFKSTRDGLIKLVLWTIDYDETVTWNYPNYCRFYDSEKEVSQSEKDYEDIKNLCVSALKKTKGSFERLLVKIPSIAKEFDLVNGKEKARAIYDTSH